MSTPIRTPAELAELLRRYLDSHPEMIQEMIDLNLDLQLVITNGQGQAAQLWLHEGSKHWQAENGCECDLLALRLKGTFVPDATRDILPAKR